MTKNRRIVTDDEFGKISKKIWELQRRFKEGTIPYDELNLYLQLIIKGKMKSKLVLHSFICEKIFTDKKVEIGPCNNLDIIANSDLPIIYLDQRLNNKFDSDEGNTKKILVEAYELILPADFITIFNFLAKNKSLRSLCFTQSQIVKFCKKHKNLFKDKGCANFFLLKVRNNVMVLNVRIKNNKFDFNLYNLNYPYIWPGEKSRRVFTAKQNED